MINSIVANVVPPNVPSSRRGIAVFGQGEAEAQQKTQPKTQPIGLGQTQVQPQVQKPEEADKFVKQPKTQTKV